MTLNDQPNDAEAQQPVNQPAAAPSNLSDKPQFVESFSSRYRAEKSFQQMVHRYLGLSRFHKARLSVGRRLRPKWHARATESLIGTYADIIFGQLIELENVEGDIGTYQEVNRDVAQKLAESEQSNASLNSSHVDYDIADRRRSEAVEQVQSSYSAKAALEEQRAAELARQIELRTDAEAIVQEKLTAYVRNSDLLTTDDSGELAFDEERVVKKLEELCLNDIIDGIERAGHKGFRTRLKLAGEGHIEYFANIEDLTELPNVNWIASIIYSRTRGYRVPQYPFLVAGKREAEGRATIDTAISVDTSGSVRERGRWDAERRTTLALHALMRQLNPENETYLSAFNDELEADISTAYLWNIRPQNGTRTDYALNWLLDTLSGRGPSMAYLITDGRPTHMQATILAAERFPEHPYVKLRIFLVDADDKARENIRQIGQAAGPDTKVAFVDSYALGENVILDVADAIGQLHSIAAV